MIKAYIEIDADPEDLILEEPYGVSIEIDGRVFNVSDIRAYDVSVDEVVQSVSDNEVPYPSPAPKEVPYPPIGPDHG